MAPTNSRPGTLNIVRDTFASDVTAVQGVDEAGQIQSGRDTKGVHTPSETLAVPQFAYHGASPALATAGHAPSREPGRVQFGTSDGDRTSSDIENEKMLAQAQAGGYDARGTKGWMPVPLRNGFWIPFSLIMILGGIGLEVALLFNTRNNGWATKGDLDSQTGFMHYVYTFPPAAIAALVVAVWAWTDIEIKKMQPYVDLIRGDAPPQKSLLLDYTRTNNYIVWLSSLRNRHYLVTLTSVVALFLAAFSPLAASLFAVKNTWWTAPLQVVQNQQLISLNPAAASGANASDISILTGELVAAAGYAGARITYPGVPNPPFILNGTTVGKFEVPSNIATNGTVLVNTTAVLSNPNCTGPAAPVNQVQQANGMWENSVIFAGCNITFPVNKTAPFLYGAKVLDSTFCVSYPSDSNTAPVMFWFFTYEPTVMASVAFCSPSIELFDVQVKYEIGPANFSSIDFVEPLSAASNFSSLAGDVSALDGRAFNGLAVDLTNIETSEQTASENMQALPQALTAAMFQSALNQGITSVFQNPEGVVPLANEIYTTYLAMVARSLYFVDQNEDLYVEVRTFRLRLWMSPIAVHMLAAAFFLLALTTIALHIFHGIARRTLVLTHQPGTIASAVSIGAKTAVGDLLADPRHMTDAELEQRLRAMKFMMNPVTLKIVSEGEDGYDILLGERERRERELREREEKDNLRREREREREAMGADGRTRRLSVFAPLANRRRSFRPTAPDVRTPQSPGTQAGSSPPRSPAGVALPASPLSARNAPRSPSSVPLPMSPLPAGAQPPASPGYPYSDEQV